MHRTTKHCQAGSQRLNMLDLTLDHLGVDVGTSSADINGIITACGQSGQRIHSTYAIWVTESFISHFATGGRQCPADKGAILVAAHRIIVGE